MVGGYGGEGGVIGMEGGGERRKKGSGLVEAGIRSETNAVDEWTDLELSVPGSPDNTTHRSAHTLVASKQTA